MIILYDLTIFVITLKVVCGKRVDHLPSGRVHMVIHIFFCSLSVFAQARTNVATNGGDIK
jgi:hypothetical protein